MPIENWLRNASGIVSGKLYTWGANGSGQLGANFPTAASVPTIVGSDNWIAFTCGGSTSAGIKADGSLWTWGANASGQLGDGTLADKHVPTHIGSDTWIAISVAQFTGNTMAGIKSDGTLWTWGNNSTLGYLGDGGTGAAPIFRSTPGLLVAPFDAMIWKKVSVGQTGTGAIRSDDTLWRWASNYSGLLGHGVGLPGDILAHTTPLQVVPGPTWKQIADGGLPGVPYVDPSAFGIHLDDTLYGWGGNVTGQLGQGSYDCGAGNGGCSVSNQYPHPTPLAIGGFWKAVSAGGGYTLGVKTDGTLWAWGNNSNGPLGDGCSGCSPCSGPCTNRNVPFQIGVATWNSISAGNGGSSPGAIGAAIKSDNTLWTWGANGTSNIGGGALRCCPAQIALTHTWLLVDVKGSGHAGAIALT